MSNDLYTRFRVPSANAEQEPTITTSKVDANYLASEANVPEYFEELLREDDANKVLKSTPQKTVPTSEPSPEELERRKQVQQPHPDNDGPTEELDPEDDTDQAVSIPSGTSLMPLGFHPQLDASPSTHRNPQAEAREIVIEDETPVVSSGHVVSPIAGR